MKRYLIGTFLWFHHRYQVTKFLLFSIIIPFYCRIDSIESGKLNYLTPLYFAWRLGMLELLFMFCPWFQHYFLDDRKFLITLYHNKSYWKFITNTTLTSLFESQKLLETFVSKYETVVPLRKNITLAGVDPFEVSELDKFYIFSRYGNEELPWQINSNLKEICRATYVGITVDECEISTFKLPKMIKETFDTYSMSLLDLFKDS